MDFVRLEVRCGPIVRFKSVTGVGSSRPRADVRRFWVLSTTDTWSARCLAGAATIG